MVSLCKKNDFSISQNFFKLKLYFLKKYKMYPSQGTKEGLNRL